MKLLQVENETFLNFLQRTDALALKRGVNVQDLPEELGISRASLFSYRTGNRPISSKAWRKLEAAERAAGIGPPPKPLHDPERSRRSEEAMAKMLAQDGFNEPTDEEDEAFIRKNLPALKLILKSMRQVQRLGNMEQSQQLRE